jgi:hypothetical protein
VKIHRGLQLTKVDPYAKILAANKYMDIKRFYYENGLSYLLAFLRENNNIDSVLPSIEVP